MASEKTNSCLICKKTFADHLAFYEHVMSHDDAKLRENDDDDDDDDDDVVLAQRLRVGSEASSDRDETTMEAAAGPVVVSYGSLANGVMLAAHSYPYPYSPSLEREGGRGHGFTAAAQRYVYECQRLLCYPPIPSRAVAFVPPPPLPPSTCSPRAVSVTETTTNRNSAATRSSSATTTTTTTENVEQKSIGEQYRDLENFAAHFKDWRVKMGYTQAAVGQSMEKHYGIVFSQTTVSRFEALQLNFHNLKKLRPVFEEWLRLEEQELSRQPPESRIHLRRRKKRTTFKRTAKEALEIHFKRQPTPSASDYAVLADALELDKEVVRIWFCNRRQKERRAKRDD